MSKLWGIVSWPQQSFATNFLFTLAHGVRKQTCLLALRRSYGKHNDHHRNSAQV